MGLTCTVLGCCGSYPGPGGACSSYLVEDGSVRLWVDAGSGSLANLQRHLTLDRVDAILLSHEHVDHWSDIEGFSVASHYALDLPPVPLYAPTGLRRRFRGEAGAFTWHEVSDGDSVALGDITVRFRRTDHGPETLAMRFDSAGRALGYTADTGPAWPVDALGEDLDVLLCEASYLSDREGTLQHLSARQAGAAARQAGAQRLVLTHLQPIIDRSAARSEAESTFGADVEVAQEGMVIEV